MSNGNFPGRVRSGRSVPVVTSKKNEVVSRSTGNIGQASFHAAKSYLPRLSEQYIGSAGPGFFNLINVTIRYPENRCVNFLETTEVLSFSKSMAALLGQGDEAFADHPVIDLGHNDSISIHVYGTIDADDAQSSKRIAKAKELADEFLRRFIRT